jgi:hypothetical protein
VQARTPPFHAEQRKPRGRKPMASGIPSSAADLSHRPQIGCRQPEVRLDSLRARSNSSTAPDWTQFLRRRHQESDRQAIHVLIDGLSFSWLCEDLTPGAPAIAVSQRGHCVRQMLAVIEYQQNAPRRALIAG